MSAHMDEEAQWESIKKWCRAHGGKALAGLALGITIIGVWEYWSQKQAVRLRTAAENYQALVVTEKITLSQADKAAKLPGVYGDVGRLHQAQQFVAAKQYRQAETILRALADHGHVPLLNQMARVRLARLVMMRKDYSEVLKILAHENDPAMRGWVSWLRGDCYLAQGDRQKAVASYQLALQQFPQNQAASSLIAMRLASINQKNK